MSKKLDESYLEALDKITDLKQQLAEKDKEITELKKSIEFLSSDKAVSTEQVKQIAREVQLKVMKECIKIIYATIRRDIYEKMETMLEEDSEWYEDSFYTKMPLNDILLKIEKIKEGGE